MCLVWTQLGRLHKKKKLLIFSIEELQLTLIMTLYYIDDMAGYV